MGIEEVVDTLITTGGHEIWVSWQQEIVPVLAEETEWADDMEMDAEGVEFHIANVLMAKWDFEDGDAAALASYYQETR